MLSLQNSTPADQNYCKQCEIGPNSRHDSFPTLHRGLRLPSAAAHRKAIGWVNVRTSNAWNTGPKTDTCEAADSRDFFGREEFTEKLIQRVGDNERFKRFLAVVDPSGKSSMVKAGLIPALWKGGLPGSERWFVEMIPGTRPFDRLEVALVRDAAIQTSALDEQLVRDQNSLLRVANEVVHSELGIYSIAIHKT
jgi:hypothetical protein